MLLNQVIFVILVLNKVMSWCIESVDLYTTQPVSQIDVSPDGILLLVGLSTKSMIYNARTLALNCQHDHKGSTLLGVKFFSDSTKVALGFEDNIKIINSSNCQQISSFSTGHIKIHDIDMNMMGTRMITCGEDKSFKIWDISTLTNSNPSFKGGFNIGKIPLSCKFTTSQDYILLGLSQINTIQIYFPSFNNSIYYQKSFTPIGNASHVTPYYCNKDKYIMGSDNGATYNFNNTSYPILQTNSTVNFVLVDRTNQFLAIGMQNGRVILVESGELSMRQTFDLGSKVLSGDFFDNSERLAVGCQNNTVKFLKRCNCSENTVLYNLKYCPIKSWPTCISPTIKNLPHKLSDSQNSQNSQNSNSQNSEHSSHTNSTNSTNSSSYNQNSSNYNQNSTNSNYSYENHQNSTNQNSTNSQQTHSNETNQNSQTNDNENNRNNSIWGNITIQQFFKNYLNSEILNTIVYYHDLKVTTTDGYDCNTLITKITNQIYSCQNYLSWKNYIRIVHPNIEQINVRCLESDLYTIVIQSTIVNDIDDPQNIYVILPSPQLLTNKTSANMTNWQKILIKISAEYNSLSYPVVYQPDQCKKKTQVYNYLLAMFILSCIIMVLGIISGKIIGLELFGVLQLSYLNLMNYRKLNIYLIPLSQFKFFNGLNIKFIQENNYDLPYNVSGINMQAQFLNNFNTMLIFSVCLILIFAVLYCIFSRKVGYKFRNLTLNLLKQSIVTLALLNSLNIGYSAGLHMKYSQYSQTTALFHVLSTLILIITILAFVLLIVSLEICQKSSFGQFRQKFKNSWVDQSYISFLLMYRIILGIYMSYNNEKWQATLFSLAIQIFFILYFVINLPYVSTLHNYRSAIIHISTLIIFFDSNYYQSMKINMKYSQKSRIYRPAILQLIMIGISVGISLITIALQVYRYLKSFISVKVQRKQIITTTEQSQQII